MPPRPPASGGNGSTGSSGGGGDQNWRWIWVALIVAVLAVLIARAGQPVTRQELFQSVWGDTVVSDAALTACIQALRGALADDVTPTGWTEAGYLDDFSVFKTTSSPTQTWLEPVGASSSDSPPAPSGTAALGSAAVVSSSTLTTTIKADTSEPALLVWSSGWDSGWRADLVGAGSDQPLARISDAIARGAWCPPKRSIVSPSFVSSILLRASLQKV